MSSDITQMQTGVNMFLRLVLRSLFVVFGAIIMAFVVNPETAYIFVIVVPILAIFVFLLTYLSIPLIKKAQIKLTTLLKKTRDNLGGVRVIRAFNLEETESKSFKQSNDDFTSFQIFFASLTP
jgi:ABC-type multidrug transport system fused ATPase/permease subunit